MLRAAASIVGAALSASVWAGGFEIRDYQGVPYVSGGVGQDQQQALQALERRFNLKLVFATQGGAYLSEVGVVIRNQRNDIVLQVESQGPWLYLKLPPGGYRAQAISGGKVIEQPVEVGRQGLTEAVLRW